MYQVQQACTFYSKQNVTHNTLCGFCQTHKTFKYLLPRFFSYGSVLKGKSEIKFHSLVTPHLCFYVTEDLKRKRNWFTLSFVTVPSCELHLHRDSLMLRRPRRLKSLNNNLNSVLHVPHTARERQSWFYLAITRNKSSFGKQQQNPLSTLQGIYVHFEIQIPSQQGKVMHILNLSVGLQNWTPFEFLKSKILTKYACIDTSWLFFTSIFYSDSNQGCRY